jgi:hypothetical protein
MERRTIPCAFPVVVSVLITETDRLGSNVTRSVLAELPETSSFPRGEVVPMPTRPEDKTVIFAVSEGPIWRDEAMVLLIPLPIATPPKGAALEVPSATPFWAAEFAFPTATLPSPVRELLMPSVMPAETRPLVWLFE